ncbi:Nardilysin, partial [Trachymyrmex zeteki]
KFRVIRLQNGLTALLISDVYSKTYVSQDQNNETDKKKTVCGLSVRVGCFNDPPEIPGMANFLKRMIFMGSEKYPQENNFEAFIKERGGSVDASIDYEHTTFYFNIQEGHLLSALDRFAQCFIKPLMKKDSIIREREDIKNEFQFVPCAKNKQKQPLSSFAETDPANKFIWDNFMTFSNNIDDDKLYEELHKFKNCHYSADRMKIAIQAILSLDTLEQYIATCFADIPNNELYLDDFKKKDSVYFDIPSIRKMFTETSCHKSYMKFKQEDEVLRWTIPLPPDFYRSKPHEYIAWVMGYKGKGSLISYLRKKITSYVGSSKEVHCEIENFLRHNSVYAVLKFTIIFSNEEEKYLEDVLDAIFSFINLLKKEDPHKRIIHYDIYKMMENDFRFINEKDSVDYVVNLCKDMHFYPPRDYIIANELICIEYNPEAIQKCLNYLMPETAILLEKHRSLPSDYHEVQSRENCYEYTYTEIPKEWIERLKSIEPLPDFHLPLKNVFIASDFSLIPIPAEVPKYPVKIYNDHISEIWYRLSPKFRLPKCYINLQFVSSLGIQSPKNAVLMEIYCRVLTLLLFDELYPALLARFECKISISEKGIVIKINGFNEKLHLLLITIAKCIVDYPALVTNILFETCRLPLLNTEYLMNVFASPDELADDVKLSVLKLIHYTRVDRHTALSNVNFKEFRRFVKSFTDHLYVQCLVQGNVTQDDAIETIQQCLKIINCGPLFSNTVQQMRVVQIPLGVSYCKLKNINETNPTSAVINYYQVGITSIESSILIDLMRIIMNDYAILCSEDFKFFSCENDNETSAIGYSITTDANKCSTEHMDQQIEALLKIFNEILKEISEKELDVFKEKFEKQLYNYAVDNDIENEVYTNWSEITKGEYVFDRFKREMLAIKDIKINDLREFFAKHTDNGSNFRKLSIHVVGNDRKEIKVEKDNNNNNTKSCEEKHFVLEYISDGQEETRVHHITNVENYKKGLYTYPVRVFSK